MTFSKRWVGRQEETTVGKKSPCRYQEGVDPHTTEEQNIETKLHNSKPKE